MEKELIEQIANLEEIFEPSQKNEYSFAPDFDYDDDPKSSDASKYSEYGPFAQMLRSVTVRPQIIFTQKELKSSDIRILKRSFVKLKDKAIGSKGILL